MNPQLGLYTMFGKPKYSPKPVISSCWLRT